MNRDGTRDETSKKGIFQDELEEFIKIIRTNRGGTDFVAEERKKYGCMTWL